MLQIIRIVGDKSTMLSRGLCSVTTVVRTGPSLLLGVQRNIHLWMYTHHQPRRSTTTRQENIYVPDLLVLVRTCMTGYRSVMRAQNYLAARYKK